MGFFDSFKKGAKAATESVRADLEGNKDFLEGVCAGIALVAAADGDIEEEEKKMALKAVTGHAVLGKLYKEAQITECLTTMFNVAGTASGKLRLNREIAEVKDRLNDRAALEDIIAIMADVSSSDGEFEEKEMKIIASVATKLGLADFANEMLAELKS